MTYEITVVEFEVQLAQFISILEVLVVTDSSYLEIHTILIQLQADIQAGAVIELTQLQFFVGMFVAFEQTTVVQVAKVFFHETNSFR